MISLFINELFDFVVVLWRLFHLAALSATSIMMLNYQIINSVTFQLHAAWEDSLQRYSFIH